MSNALQLVTDDDLLSLASALRRGDLATPFGNEILLTQYCPKGLATGVTGTFRQLSLDGFSPPQIARLLETIVETRAGRPELEKLINLVWTGPEVPGQTRRETAPVVRELFASATFSVQVASYAIHKGADIFQPLADRMLEFPSLRVELFVDLNGLTPLDFGQRFLEEAWPLSRPLPAVYFDPRSGPAESGKKASLHAKLVVTDAMQVFVTSANFTERAHSKNIETGLLVKSAHLAEQIGRNFRLLIADKLLLPLTLVPFGSR